MDLKKLGWNSFFEEHFVAIEEKGLVPARVVEEMKGFHKVRDEQGEYLAEISGKIRFQAEQREDLPAVGDWVAIAPRPEQGRARIQWILPRKTRLSRKVAGKAQAEQIVATNVDTVFLVSSLNRDLNARRIERYLAAVWESGARPVVLLNKADLCRDSAALAAEVEEVAIGVPVHVISAGEGRGIESLQKYFVEGETAAFVGSSGVGKSTIINALAGEELLRVQSVRESDDRGKHTTTARQMIFLSGGGIVIDTPGMRELQLWEIDEGVQQTFEDIDALATQCKFRDCGHSSEPGCAVQAAIRGGELQRERLDNFKKLQAELEFQASKVDPKVAQDRKERWLKIHKAARKKGNRI